MEIKTRQWRPEQMLLVSALREGFGPQVRSDLGRAMEAERPSTWEFDQEASRSLRPGKKLPRPSLRNGPWPVFYLLWAWCWKAAPLLPGSPSVAFGPPQGWSPNDEPVASSVGTLLGDSHETS